MSANTKLQNAMNRIHKILIEENIGGAITLHTPGSMLNLTDLTPSYSCVNLKPKKLGFLTAKENYKSPEERNQVLADTSNMLKLLADGTEKQFEKLKTVSNSFDLIFKAQHSPSQRGIIKSIQDIK